MFKIIKVKNLYEIGISFYNLKQYEDIKLIQYFRIYKQ